jgi:hypothetical protein
MQVQLGVLILVVITGVATATVTANRHQEEEATIMMAGAANGVCDYKFNVNGRYPTVGKDVIFGVYDKFGGGWTRTVALTPAEAAGDYLPFVVAREPCLVDPCRLTLKTAVFGSTILLFNVSIQTYDYSQYSPVPTPPSYDTTFRVYWFLTSDKLFEVNKCGQ